MTVASKQVFHQTVNDQNSMLTRQIHDQGKNYFLIEYILILGNLTPEGPMAFQTPFRSRICKKHPYKREIQKQPNPLGAKFSTVLFLMVRVIRQFP